MMTGSNLLSIIQMCFRTAMKLSIKQIPCRPRAIVLQEFSFSETPWSPRGLIITAAIKHVKHVMPVDPASNPLWISVVAGMRSLRYFVAGEIRSQRNCSVHPRIFPSHRFNLIIGSEWKGLLQSGSSGKSPRAPVPHR
jgi:hypothetical protein